MKKLNINLIELQKEVDKTISQFYKTKENINDKIKEYSKIVCEETTNEEDRIELRRTIDKLIDIAYYLKEQR